MKRTHVMPVSLRQSPFAAGHSNCVEEDAAEFLEASGCVFEGSEDRFPFGNREPEDFRPVEQRRIQPARKRRGDNSDELPEKALVDRNATHQHPLVPPRRTSHVCLSRPAVADKLEDFQSGPEFLEAGRRLANPELPDRRADRQFRSGSRRGLGAASGSVAVSAGWETATSSLRGGRRRAR